MVKGYETEVEGRGWGLIAKSSLSLSRSWAGVASSGNASWAVVSCDDISVAVAVLVSCSPRTRVEPPSASTLTSPASPPPS